MKNKYIFSTIYNKLRNYYSNKKNQIENFTSYSIILKKLYLFLTFILKFIMWGCSWPF